MFDMFGMFDMFDSCYGFLIILNDFKWFLIIQNIYGYIGSIFGYIWQYMWGHMGAYGYINGYIYMRIPDIIWEPLRIYLDVYLRIYIWEHLRMSMFRQYMRISMRW